MIRLQSTECSGDALSGGEEKALIMRAFFLHNCSQIGLRVRICSSICPKAAPSFPVTRARHAGRRRPNRNLSGDIAAPDCQICRSGPVEVPVSVDGGRITPRVWGAAGLVGVVGYLQT